MRLLFGLTVQAQHFTKLNDQEIMRGITGNMHDYKLMNHLLTLGKQTIFCCRQQKLLPLLLLFQVRLQCVIWELQPQIETCKLLASAPDKVEESLTFCNKFRYSGVSASSYQTDVHYSTRLCVFLFCQYQLFQNVSSIIK